MSTMRLSLKAGERLFINGAVLRAEKRVTIELLNDATFLLEAHVMQIEEATTSLKRLYFIIQSMLIDPQSAPTTRESVFSLLSSMHELISDKAILEGLSKIGEQIANDKAFEALRLLRSLFPLEEGYDNKELKVA